jgi:DNA polymerase-3 subunit delta
LKQEFAQVLTDLKNKIYHPIYFLFGEESYYIDQVVDYIEKHVLNESERAFNFQVLYGKEVDAMQVMESARRLPMMANHQLIIVKEAQQLSSFGKLEDYFKNPTPSTILVLAYKHSKPDKRKTVFKELIASKSSSAMESKAIRDYEVSKWITNYAREKKLTISPKGVEMLTEFLGADISKIVNEIDKLQMILGEKVSISEDDIERNIGASKDYNIFEFTAALGDKNLEKTYRILHYFEANPKGLVLPIALGTIHALYQKIYLCKYSGGSADRDLAVLLKTNPYFVKDYKRYANNYSLNQLERTFEILGEYDLKSKGLGNKSLTSYELLTEMTYKIYSL